MLAALKSGSALPVLLRRIERDVRQGGRDCRRTSGPVFIRVRAYGISKVAGFELTRNYREAYGMHAVSGILFNHESPRRGFEFVTRKITSGVARIAGGQSHELQLAIWKRGATGDTRGNTWKPCGACCSRPSRMITWWPPAKRIRCGNLWIGLSRQVGLDYREYVVGDPTLFRPAEVNLLQGDSTKAQSILGWQSTITFEALVREMVEADCRALGVAPVSLQIT